jgi:DNA modification methylase
LAAPYFRPNTIYCGDSRDILRKFPNECVDLIYADPPFFSNRRYEVIWGDGYELRAFEDRWKGGINNYAAWLMERVGECFRVLKRTGSMYLHLDHHASHYAKVEMDRLFGEENFINEIVWQRQTAKHSDSKQGAKHYGRLHDVILFYAKSPDYTWNQQYVAFSNEYVEKSYSSVEPKTGRKYQLVAIDGPGGAAKGNPRYEFLGVTRYWRYSRERMAELYKEGRIIQTKPGNVPRYKMYLDEMLGVPLQDLWTDIKPVSTSSESLGFPTQKPEALLERIVKTSSNPTDIVLDPFCGCGTALAVAQRLGRRWIGVDVSPTSCELMMKRMRGLRASPQQVGMPMSSDDLRALQPFDFQNWVIQRLFGRISATKSSDMGIDGYTFEGAPVQVKQSDDIGRNVVDNFETAMRRMKAVKGVIVAFSFGKGAYEEAARAKLHEGLEIDLVTVGDLLKGGREGVQAQ